MLFLNTVHKLTTLSHRVSNKKASSILRSYQIQWGVIFNKEPSTKCPSIHYSADSTITQHTEINTAQIFQVAFGRLSASSNSIKLGILAFFFFNQVLLKQTRNPHASLRSAPSLLLNWLSQNGCYPETVSNILLLQQHWIHSLCFQVTSAPLSSVLPTRARFLPAGSSCCVSLANLKLMDTHSFTRFLILFLLHLHPSPKTPLGFYMQNTMPFGGPVGFSL